MSLKKKELTIICCGGLLLLGILYYSFVVSPAIGREESLERLIEKKELTLQNMQKLLAEWEKLNKAKEDALALFKKRGRNFTLLSYLEAVSRQTGVSDKIQYMKPVSYPETKGPFRLVGMEVKLEEIDMKQLVSYLYKIEYSGLYIPKIKIQRTKGKTKENAFLKVTLQVSTGVRS